MADPAGSALERLVRRLTGREAQPGKPDEAALLAQLDAVAHVSGREALDVALGALMRQVGAQRGFIAVRDEAGGLRFVAARAFASLRIETPEAELSRSILRAAFEDAGLLVVEDAAADNRFADAKSVQTLRLKAVLVAPLNRDGKPFGVLYLDNPAEAAAFDDARRASASALAELIAPVVAREIELDDLRRTVAAGVEALRSTFDFENIVGESAPMLALMKTITKVAPTKATVLVRGETGTGKELVARAVHAQSRRADGPFVAINCAALPADLVEAELFGHERGAFTGADRARIGRFEAADGGTLFLDEVAELPLDAQAKLLRVLEEGQFERVGSSEPKTVNVRLIAATHADLRDRVALGSFREDLLFRIRVLELEVPALRERDSDVLLIAERLLARFASEYGSPAREFDPATRLALQTYLWPGNVRELRNVIERAAILATQPIVDASLLPPEIAGAAADPDAPPLDIKNAVREFKRRFVQQARTAAGGDHKTTAALLGVNAKYLYQMLKDLGLSTDASS
ncbi:MAG: sigma 54-interacting transcriptional regulator [Nannocystaceae bacterium]|nr:sigma-54-dependent Fis family transcriptional regulator [bacterium]